MNSQNSYKYINIFIYIFFIVLFFLQGLSTSEAKRQACAVCLSFCQGKAEKCDAIPFVKEQQETMGETGSKGS